MPATSILVIVFFIIVVKREDAVNKFDISKIFRYSATNEKM